MDVAMDSIVVGSCRGARRCRWWSGSSMTRHRCALGMEGECPDLPLAGAGPWVRLCAGAVSWSLAQGRWLLGWVPGLAGSSGWCVAQVDDAVVVGLGVQE